MTPSLAEAVADTSRYKTSGRTYQGDTKISRALFVLLLPENMFPFYVFYARIQLISIEGSRDIFSSPNDPSLLFFVYRLFPGQLGVHDEGRK